MESSFTGNSHQVSLTRLLPGGDWCNIYLMDYDTHKVIFVHSGIFCRDCKNEVHWVTFHGKPSRGGAFGHCECKRVLWRKFMDNVCKVVEKASQPKKKRR